MEYILDIAVVLIVFLTMFTVIKKGFVKSLLDLMSVVCSVVLAKMFSSKVALFFYDTLNQSVGKTIEESLHSMVKTESLPTELQNNNLNLLAEQYGIDFVESVSDSAENMISSLSGTVVGFLSYAIAYIAIFLCVMIAFKLITPLVCLIFKLPVLSTINKTLSIVLAIVLTGLYLFIFVSLMQLIIPVGVSINPETTFNEQLISQTYLFKYLYNIEWLNIFIS